MPQGVGEAGAWEGEMERWREGDEGERKKMRENGERERVGERERKVTGMPVTVTVSRYRIGCAICCRRYLQVFSFRLAG